MLKFLSLAALEVLMLNLFNNCEIYMDNIVFKFELYRCFSEKSSDDYLHSSLYLLKSNSTEYI